MGEDDEMILLTPENEYNKIMDVSLLISAKSLPLLVVPPTQFVKFDLEKSLTVFVADEFEATAPPIPVELQFRKLQPEKRHAEDRRR
jgi:hypothetical protein